MEIFTALLCCLLVAALLLLLRRNYKSASSLSSRLPGPAVYPLVGTLGIDPASLHVKFAEWQRAYGDVFTFNILTQPVVVLNSYETVREALFSKSAAFAARPRLARAEELLLSKAMAFQSSNDAHKHLRRTSLRSLKVHGQYLLQLEKLINDHLADLVDLFKAEQGAPFDPRAAVYKFLYNIILSLLLGEKLSYDDPIFTKLQAVNAAYIKAMSFDRIHHDIIPGVSRLVDPQYADVARAAELRRQIVEPLYRQCKDTYVAGHERGILDVFIADVENHLITDDSAIGVLMDFLIAGVETTSTTLYGFLLVLLHNPDVQRELRSEVDHVVGRDRVPHLADRCRMPFTEATVLELLRYLTPLPILLPYEMAEDVTVGGRVLPKGSWVLPNAWSVNHNGDVYEEPFSFKPRRFLSDAGELLLADHPIRRNLLSFGIGPRHCPGEMLAKNRLFLTLATLVQRFEIAPDAASQLPTADPRESKLKIIFDVKEFKLRALSRDE